jgi:effector-binding domain-containing protein
MLNEIHLSQVLPRRLAVVREQTEFRLLGAVIPKLLDEVYSFLKDAPVTRTGQNIVLYLDAKPTIEVGVEVSGPFDRSGRVLPSSTPGGMTVSMEHRGPYANLPAAHQAIQRFCAETGRRPVGPNWEIYADWEEDPEKLRTQVFYLVL